MDLIVEKKNQVLYVTFNRPDMHNSFYPKLIKEIKSVFDKDARKPDVRVVVLKGAGASFSAGADLTWMKSMVNLSKSRNQKDALELFEMFESIASCPAPVIASVHGNVMGGGVGLAAVADITLAEFDTKFCFSEVRLGIAPAVISSFVHRKMQASFARDLMMSARIFDAQTALQSGLVQYVGRELEMAQQLDMYIDHFKKAGFEAVRATKKLLNSLEGMTHKQAKLKTTQLIAQLRTGDEGQEGIRAFLEKRKPKWIENAKKN
jgi:methylglutaconyl-CoA hydratase